MTDEFFISFLKIGKFSEYLFSLAATTEASTTSTTEQPYTTPPESTTTQMGT